MKNNNKKYFAFDKKLTSIEDDYFKHEDLSDNVCDLIENKNYDSSFNIALIGRWGIGKSSLLNFVEKKLKKDGYKNVYTINAWKYEKESIRIVLLKNIINKIDKKKSFISMLIDIIHKTTKDNKQKEKISFSDIFEVLKKSKSIIIIMIIATIISGLCKMYLSKSGFFGVLRFYGFWGSIIKAVDYAIDSFFLNLIISIMLAILTKFIGNFAEKVSSPLDITPIINDTCCYEEILDDVLKNKEKEKYIFILDDIDRLSKEKIVETLDALKILMDRDNLYFIVPFDDSIVKRALEKNNIDLLDPDHQIIQSELILDKLFKFKIYLNPLVPSDITDYTLKLIKEEISDIKDFINENDIPALVKILIHKGVTTPRQVKKIINIFMNNVIIINKRCGKKDVNNLLNYNGYELIAKLSVLQADFNDFYDTLIIHNDNIDVLIKYHEEGVENFNEIRSELKFLFNDDTKQIKNEYIQLLNFLSNTKTIKTNNISSYLYLNESKISLKYTDEMSRNISDSIESGNTKSAMNYIESENKDLSELVISIMDEAKKDSYINIYNVCIELFIKYYSTNENFANSLSNLIDKIYCDVLDTKEIRITSAEKLVSLFNCVNYRGESGITKLLNDHVSWIIEEKEIDNVKNINVLINNNEKRDYTSDTKELIRNAINEFVIGENIDTIDFLNELKLPLRKYVNKYFDIKFLRNIKDFYINDEEKSEKAYHILKEVILANGAVENKDVCNIIEDLYLKEDNISILNSILIANDKEGKDD